MSLDVFEEAINQLSDQDLNWWPFLWMRPAKVQRMSIRRLACVALLYGLPAGALGSILLALAFPQMRTGMPLGLMGFPALLFVFGNAIAAPMWNRRAARLRAMHPTPLKP